MTENEIKINIATLCKEMFGKEIYISNYKENFFSKSINIMPYELVYLIHKVEDVYNIKLTDKELLDENYYNIEDLSILVLKKCR